MLILKVLILNVHRSYIPTFNRTFSFHICIVSNFISVVFQIFLYVLVLILYFVLYIQLYLL